MQRSLRDANLPANPAARSPIPAFGLDMKNSPPSHSRSVTTMGDKLRQPCRVGRRCPSYRLHAISAREQAGAYPTDAGLAG